MILFRLGQVGANLGWFRDFAIRATSRYVVRCKLVQCYMSTVSQEDWGRVNRAEKVRLPGVFLVEQESWRSAVTLQCRLSPTPGPRVSNQGLF